MPLDGVFLTRLRRELAGAVVGALCANLRPRARRRGNAAKV